MSGHGDPLSFLSPEALAALEGLVRAIVVEVAGGGSAGARRREPELLTVEEAAEVLRAKPQRVYDLLSDGRLTRSRTARGCSSAAARWTTT